MADWDFLDEVDVLAKLDPKFKELVESKKWTERKEGLESLLSLLTANPRLSTKANYGEIVNTIQIMLAKDANINVNALAAKCLAGIASGLRTKFAPFAAQIIPVCAERFKEKKPLLRDPLIECIDAVATTIQLESALDEIVAGMEKPNPQIKLQMDSFIGRQMNMLNTDKAPRKLIKAVVPILAKHASDADGEVREAALFSIGTVQRLIGDKNVRSMIGDLEKDEMKMKKISDAAAKAAEISAEFAAKSAPPASTNATNDVVTVEKSAPSSNTKTQTKAKESDPWEFLEPFDILSKMPSNWEGETGVESKKWAERRDALQALLDLLTANPRLCPKGNYSELVGVLRKLAEKDANINVAALAVKCLTCIATGLRTKFSPHANSVAAAIVEKFKEKKPILRDALVECIDAVHLSANLESLETEIAAGLGKANPSIKQQSGLFLRRSIPTYTSTTMPKKTLKTLVAILVKHTGDSDADVRDAACAALGAAMGVIGEKAAMTMMTDIAEDKIKMTKIKEVADKVREEVGDKEEVVGIQEGKESLPPAKKHPVKKAKEEVEEEEEENVVPKTVKKTLPKEERKEEEDEPVKKKVEEVFSVNEEKRTRIRDEKTLKILKWNFVAPDDEHTNQLMTLIGQQAKASLVSLLFHKDFKMHLKAIDELSKVGDTQPEALVKNSDLILKWCTLRFFETNPAALIKVLELALRILTLCNEMGEEMSNEEASSFMPYLVLKTGEQKENMRMVVREIVDVMSSLCGPVKLCPFVIDALKTKNSRQRAECLIVLEKYVATVGLAQLKSLGIVKAMTCCVSDRDNNVRNAAINGVVACYKDEGDKIWALAGKMEEKDKCLVMERIKRSGAVPGSAVRPPTGGPKIASQQNGSGVRGRGVSSNREESRTRDSSPVTSREANRTFDARDDNGEGKGNATSDTGRNRRFQLDMDFINGNDATSSGSDGMTLSQYIEKLDSVEVAPPSRYAPSNLKRSNSTSSIGSSVVDTLEALDRVITNVSSAQSDCCIEALEQLNYILGVDEQRPLLVERMDLLLPALASQIKLIRNFVDRQDEEKLGERMKTIFNFLSNLTSVKSAFRSATGQGLEPLVHELIITLCDQKFKMQLKESDQATRTINRICIRSCALSEPNAFFFAVTNCIKKDLENGMNESVSLFCKCLLKFATDLREQLDMNTFANTANAFYLSCPARERPSLIHDEALNSVKIATEKAFICCKSTAREAFTRIRHLDPRLGVHVEAWTEAVANTAVHPLILTVLRDMQQMPKSIAALADYISHKPEERSMVERQLERVPCGDVIGRKVREYCDFREGRSENAPIFASIAVLSLLQRVVNAAIGSNTFLGADASSLGFNQGMTSSVSLPSVPIVQSSLPSVPTVTSQPQKKRRTLKPEELAPFKERLNQIAGDN